MLMGGMRMAIRPFRRVDPPLPQTHRCETVQVPPLRPVLQPLGPSGPAHEAARLERRLRHWDDT